MKRQSDKQKKHNAIISKIKAKKIAKMGRRCIFCRNTFNDVDLVHIIRRSYSEALKADERNMVLGCRTCHAIFDDGDASGLLKYPTFEPILNRMKSLDEPYYNRFKRKRIDKDI